MDFLDRIYNQFMDVTYTFTGKLDTINESLQGRVPTTENENNKEPVFIVEEHHRYIKHLEKTNPKEYKRLELFAKIYNESNVGKRKILLHEFFSRYT